MDVQAKDRLTGAVILVVLLVLIVPELLTGPAHTSAVAVKRTEGTPLRSYTMELGDERSRHELSSAAPETDAAAPPAAATAAPERSPPVIAAPAPPSPSAPAAPPPSVKGAPAAANPVVSEAPGAGGWSVQLGSFASRANAERLVRELKTKGFAANWTESGSGAHKLYRVRVGPAAQHAAAESLAARLRAAGHPGTLSQRP